MKPSKLLWLGAISALVGSCFLYTFYIDMYWYVEHISSDLTMGLLVFVVLLMTMGGTVLFAYGLQKLLEEQ